MNMIQDFNILSHYTIQVQSFQCQSLNLLLQGNNTVSSKKHQCITVFQKLVWFCVKLLGLQSVK